MLKKIQFLLPLALPFIVYLLFEGGLALYPVNIFSQISDQSYFLPLTFVLLIGLFFLIHLLMPIVTQKFWKCQSLKGPIRQRLDALCAKANFHCRDIKTWGVMDHALTAAIIGIHPRFRYVLFTKRLIREMKPECIEAILCHEIGHSYHRHLLLFPFILGGMGICGVAASYLITYSFDFFIGSNIFSDMQEYLYDATMFVAYGITALVYFRYVFGYFSRLFERQADLHIFNVKLNPSHLIEALNYFAQSSGQDPRKPDWHHYSIQERIDYITVASKHQNLIAIHHSYVQTMLYIYFGCFFSLLLLFFS
ncbi:MAG: M48 family metalloprotease [Parachlamydiaceae bacterium]|nr:M48 family metalloprotease [Parachlamydiaceae bacterium]